MQRGADPAMRGDPCTGTPSSFHQGLIRLHMAALSSQATSFPIQGTHPPWGHPTTVPSWTWLLCRDRAGDGSNRNPSTVFLPWMS